MGFYNIIKRFMGVEGSNAEKWMDLAVCVAAAAVFGYVLIRIRCSGLAGKNREVKRSRGIFIFLLFITLCAVGVAGLSLWDSSRSELLITIVLLMVTISVTFGSIRLLKSFGHDKIPWKLKAAAVLAAVTGLLLTIAGIAALLRCLDGLE